MRRALCPLIAALTLSVPLLSAGQADEKDFVPLYDGKTLKGWKKAGGPAIYRPDGDCIVGEVPKGGLKGNAFLCTEKEYANFILKVDVKLDVPGNSGIQFRSHINDKGRVYGYQCEIDPSKRAWSGGIYDEGRRGWLFKLDKDEKAQKAFKLDGWNQFVIHAEGPRLRTWINGVPCADLQDKTDRSGFIALQVHSGKEGRIRWKNPRIKVLPDSK